MVNKTQEALKMAIKALELINEHAFRCGIAQDAIKMCKEALAELQEQKPVAWMHRHEGEITEFNDFKSCDKCEPRYTLPQPREWVNLTDMQITNIGMQHQSLHQVAYAISDALKQLNTKG